MSHKYYKLILLVFCWHSFTASSSFSRLLITKLTHPFCWQYVELYTHTVLTFYIVVNEYEEETLPISTEYTSQLYRGWNKSITYYKCTMCTTRVHQKCIVYICLCSSTGLIVFLKTGLC